MAVGSTVLSPNVIISSHSMMEREREREKEREREREREKRREGRRERAIKLCTGTLEHSTANLKIVLDCITSVGVM